MKYFSTTLLLFSISTHIFSQNWEKLYDSTGIYSEKGDYNKALPLAQKAVLAAKKEFGAAHFNYAKSLFILADVYDDLNEYKMAESHYLQSADILRNVKDKDFEYAYCLNSLASLYKKTGENKKAESLYNQLIGIIKKTSGEENSGYATILNNLAELYRNMAQDNKAEPFFLQAKDIFQKINDEESPEYAGILNNLGLLYNSKGQYINAESFFLKAIKIFKNKSGEESLEYATCLNNLALLYFNIGQYENAESLYIQVKDICKNTYGKESLEYATILNNLAGLYHKKKNYELAESLFIPAMNIYRSKFGQENTNYAFSLNNLALLYNDMGKFEMAEPLYIQARDIFKNKLGQENTYYALSLNNLALLYMNMKQFEKAEPSFIQAINIWKKEKGADHPDYATCLTNLALIYFYTGRYEKAEILVLQVNQIVMRNLKKIFTILSDKEKGNYVEHNVFLTELNNSLMYYKPKASSAFIRNNFDQQLFSKSLTLADTRNVLESLRQSPDKDLQELLNDWQNYKTELAKQYSLPVVNRRPDLKQLEDQTEALEKELTRKSSAFSNQQKAISISMKEVQQNLLPDEAAIEFVSFDMYNYNKGRVESTIYAAYILRKNDSVPSFITLFEDKQLQLLLNKADTIAFNSDADAEEKEMIRVDSLYSRKELYDLVWRPLEPYLKGMRKISYSPAGKLYGIAFHALRADSINLLMDKYLLQQYTSTREVALRPDNDDNTKTTGITLFGNASFTLDSLQLVKQRTDKPGKENVSSSLLLPQKGSRGNNAWPQLPGTAEEVKSIQQLFEQNKIVTKTFVQTTASEENLKSLSGNSPQILHIASHGFFLPDPAEKKKDLTTAGENAYTLAGDPLLRSGIVFAGGNYVWSGKKPIEGVDDGIATAYEISQLDLSKTELVVLSACQSALGDVKRSEGVFGLQRAFKMAGVKQLLVSLWKVPDKETAQLMISFYGYLMRGKGIDESFRLAQADMRKKSDGDIYYWAAFVLVE